MGFLKLVIPIFLLLFTVGCSSYPPPTSPVHDELSRRSNLRVGIALAKARKSNRGSPIWAGIGPTKATITVFIKGPKSLTGRVYVRGASVIRYEVADLRYLVNSLEDGVRIRAALSGRTWPDQINLFYHADGRIYKVKALKDELLGVNYESAPKSLKMGPFRGALVKVKASNTQSSSTTNKLVAVERSNGKTIYYYLLRDS